MVTGWGGKLDDSSVPVHVPAIWTEGSGGFTGGGGGGGVGAIGADPQPSGSRNNTSASAPRRPGMIR